MSYIIKPALNLHVNRMQLADLDQVVSIEKSVFAQDRWTRKQFCRLLQDGAVAMVAWRPFNSGRQVLGYFVYENCHPYHFELINLAVAPAYQNHGVGPMAFALTFERVGVEEKKEEKGLEIKEGAGF